MSKNTLVRQYGPLIVSGGLTLLFVGIALTLTSIAVVALGVLLSYVSQLVFHQDVMGVFQYVLVILATACTAGLGIPILLLARNLQRSNEHFSLLQLEDELEDAGEFDDDESDEDADGEELNEFLKNLHTTRNIGPFIPSPKTMDDLCPCGSGIKYKDCCGKFWV